MINDSIRVGKGQMKNSLTTEVTEAAEKNYRMIRWQVKFDLWLCIPFSFSVFSAPSVVRLAIARQAILHGVGQDFFVSGRQLQAKFDA